MRFIKESLKDTTEKPMVHPDESIQPSSRDGIDPSKHVRRLGICEHHLGDDRHIYYPNVASFYTEFRLNDRVKAAVDAARKRFDQATNGLAVDIFLYEGFRKEFCKAQKVSPDAMMQLGFQVNAIGEVLLKEVFWKYLMVFF